MRQRVTSSLLVLSLFGMASPTLVKNTGSAASNDTTTVWYGVKSTASQPNGPYTDTVTYTATTN